MNKGEDESDNVINFVPTGNKSTPYDVVFKSKELEEQYTNKKCPDSGKFEKENGV